MNKMMMAVGLAAMVAAVVPKEAAAFTGLFESKPTKAEIEKMDALFNGYYKAPDEETAIAVLPSVKKMNKMKPGGVLPMIGFYFGAAKASVESHRSEWEATKQRGGKEVAAGIGAALDGKSLDDMVPSDLEDYAPGILDFLWGYFLATGDAEAPRRVIRRGGMTVPDKPGVVDLTARAAQWSSVSLAKNHPAVAAELESFALNADEKSVRNFFGPALNDDARAVLSPAAVARIVSCGVAERRELTERELREAVKDSQYLGMTKEEVIAKFGEPDKPDGTYNEIGIYWHVWPEVERELGAKPSNTPDATVRELYWNCETNVVVVWLVKSNGVWRVAKDITVEDGVVF